MGLCRLTLRSGSWIWISGSFLELLRIKKVRTPPHLSVKLNNQNLIMNTDNQNIHNLFVNTK